MLKAENISYSYPGQEKKALNQVSLNIPQGCFTAILGHNGSGKSTLAKMFNGLLIPQAGNVNVGDLSVLQSENIWQIRSQVGMVFQNPDNQIVATTVEEDVAFGPENLGIQPQLIRQRVAEALHKVGMWENRKQAPHHLSGGQKQRVAVAGVLAMQPKYIFFDEATAMLDPQGRKDLLATILELHKQNDVTPVIITHFMEEAALAERVVVMAAGKIVMEGRPRQVLTSIAKLQELKLGVPVATELCNLLRQQGLNLRTDIITDEELVEELCRLKSKM